MLFILIMFLLTFLIDFIVIFSNSDRPKILKILWLIDIFILYTYLTFVIINNNI